MKNEKLLSEKACQTVCIVPIDEEVQTLKTTQLSASAQTEEKEVFEKEI